MKGGRAWVPFHQFAPPSVLERMNFVNHSRPGFDTLRCHRFSDLTDPHCSYSRSHRARVTHSSGRAEVPKRARNTLLARIGQTTLYDATPIQVPSAFVNMSVVPESRVGR